MPVQIRGNIYYKSSEVSAFTSVSKSTIHRWIKAGIIPEVARKDRNGWRLFSIDDIARIELEREGGICETTVSEGRGDFEECETKGGIGMSVKSDNVKQFLEDCFGELSGKQVDKQVKQGMSDDEILAKAKAKVSGLLGADKAAELDKV